MHELATNYSGFNACFATFTYDEAHIGDNDLKGTVRDLQLLWKRIRKYYGRGLKYFACGEYGDNTQRRHAHSIIFGLPCSSQTEAVLLQLWKNGYVKVGSVTRESIRYVCDYVLKKYNGEKAKAEYGERFPPFRVLSRGLGRDFLLQNRDAILENAGYFVGGLRHSLPRYYLSLLKKTMSDKEYREFMYRLNKENEKKHFKNISFAKDKYGDSAMVYYLAEQSSKNKEAHADYMLKNRHKGGI